jgi:hypothetical protein
MSVDLKENKLVICAVPTPNPTNASLKMLNHLLYSEIYLHVIETACESDIHSASQKIPCLRPECFSPC